jgi:hypothetical protein
MLREISSNMSGDASIPVPIVSVLREADLVFHSMLSSLSILSERLWLDMTRVQIEMKVFLWR